MPLMHRLACLRDDLIFLIVLYQRYIYPIDKKRVNEFGQVFEGEELEQAKVSRSETNGRKPTVIKRDQKNPNLESQTRASAQTRAI